MERVYAATASACLPALRSRSPSCLAPSADFSRSVSDGFTADFAGLVSLCVAGWFPLDPVAGFCRSVAGGHAGGRLPLGGPHMPHHRRSEEHTSELQSPRQPVCRLLLCKKSGPLSCDWSTALDPWLRARLARTVSS